MWLYSKCGFFSAVQHFQKPDTIHLRARFEGDLERLFRKYRVKAKVTFTPDNDYAFRANVKKPTWARIVAAEAEDIDYDNFKHRVHDGTERDSAYMGVWMAMRRGQEGRLFGQPRLDRPLERLRNAKRLRTVDDPFDSPEGGHWN